MVDKIPAVVPIRTTGHDVFVLDVDDARDGIVPGWLFECGHNFGVTATDVVVNATWNKVGFDGINDLGVAQNLSAEITTAFSARDFLE